MLQVPSDLSFPRHTPGGGMKANSMSHPPTGQGLAEITRSKIFFSTYLVEKHIDNRS